ncbi:preprotein translocase subunit YajC [Microbacterium sp. JZ101]
MDILLLVVLAALLVFMFISSRRRTKKMKEEQERRQLQMVPGARIMTRSGLFGTIVAFDPEDLTKPAEVEIAPGVVIEVHAQAIDLAPETAVAETADEDAPADEEPADAEEELLNLSGADVEKPTTDDRAPDADGTGSTELPGDDKPKN